MNPRCFSGPSRLSRGPFSKSMTTWKTWSILGKDDMSWPYQSGSFSEIMNSGTILMSPYQYLSGQSRPLSRHLNDMSRPYQCINDMSWPFISMIDMFQKPHILYYYRTSRLIIHLDLWLQQNLFIINYRKNYTYIYRYNIATIELMCFYVFLILFVL